MSKNAKGILGDQTGKVGPVVAKRWMGLQTYSAYQPNVRNPRTTSQQTNRAKFRLLASLSRALRPAILLGFHDESVSANKTRYNMFFKANYSAVQADSPENVQYDPEDLVVSEGGLTMFGTGNVDATTPQQIRVPITVPTLDGSVRPATDQCYIVAFSPDYMMCVMSDGMAKRTDTEIVLPVPARWQGLSVAIYAFATDGADMSSMSTYVGTATIA